MLNERVRAQPFVVEGGRRSARLEERVVCLGQLPRLDERRAELRQERGSCRVGGGKERARPLEQVDRSGQVAPTQGLPASCLEQGGRADGEWALEVAASCDLGQVPICLLEVVADHLVVVVMLGLEPVRHHLVELGADLLGKHGVGGVAGQDMGEAEAVVTRELGRIGPDELLVDERQEVRLDVGTRMVGQELAERAAVEVPAFDRGTLEHRSLAGLEAVDACCQHGLDARRQRRLTVGRIHRDELFEEQRVSLRGLHDPCPRLRVQLLDAERVDEAPRLALGQRVEREQAPAGARRRPVGMGLEQLGPGEAQEQDRPPAGEAGDVVEEIEQCRLRPVHVFEDREQGTVAGGRLEQSAHGPEGLFAAAGLAEPDRSEHALGDEVGVLVAVQELGDALAWLVFADQDARSRPAAGR